MSVDWRPVKIGGGGFITGIDIANNGTRIVRADVYGAYRWNGSSWSQLVTASSMPTADVDLNNGFGVYEIRAAPGYPVRVYMMYNGYVYRSDNSGTTWQKYSPPRQADSDANGTYRHYGRKMAVDPHNDSIVYVSTPAGGVWKSVDRGANWTNLTSLGTASGPGYSIAFYRNAPTINTNYTSVIYIARYGTGVYRSTDAGSTWTLLSGSPTSFGHMVVGDDGTLYVTPYNRTNNLHIFKNGAWSVTNVASDPDHFGFAVAVDQANTKRIIVVADNGSLSQSTDGGATWSGFKGWTPVSNDIGWLAATSPWYMSVGDIAFDPTQSNTLYLAAGAGVWKTNPSTAMPTWTSETIGIEELVANTVIAPPYGKPLVASWDRPVFRINDPEVFPTAQPTATATAIIHGWALDYAPAQSSFIAGIFNNYGDDRSGYSTDGGATWQQFANKPAHVVNGNNKIGGCIAVGSSTNMLWFPSFNCPGYYTRDGGWTWKEVTISGVSNDPATESGWGYMPWLKRYIVAADRVTPNVFYAYNYLKGLYRSGDCGASWSLVYAGEISAYSKYNAKLRAMPGMAGMLFFTNGNSSGEKLASPGTAPLRRSLDGGRTWMSIGSVTDVFDIGFGAPVPGTTLATIFIIGFVNGVYGYHRSTNGGTVWTSMGQWPTGRIDNPQCVSGDMAIYGRIYAGFSGSGFAYRDA